MEYAELLCKSNYSFLQGASYPSELVEKAASLGLTALALNDKNGVYGIPKAYFACQKYPALKLIVGAEISLENHPPLTLLVQNREAYGLLCRLITQAHQSKPKGTAFVSLNEFSEFLQKPAAKGWIAIPSDGKDAQYDWIWENFKERAFLPLCRVLDGLDKDRERRVCGLRKRYGFRIIATNDVHFHVPERRKLQDVLTSIREGVTLSKAGFKLFSNSERYLKSPEQMKRLFQSYPEAIQQTVEIARNCSFSPSELRYHYPTEWIPVGHTSQSYLEELVWKGAQLRYRNGIPPDVTLQIRHELKLIESLSFADYFLTVYDIMEFARARGILCQGRGSAANSVVCYCLHITAIDPVRMNLLFERFMSTERGEPPDIDVDFEHERREEVIHYVYEKYGRDRAAMVSAVVTYRSRSAFREVSKVMGVPVGTLSSREVQNRFSKLTAELSIEQPELKAQIEHLSEELHGFPRHLSIHSGGFTLSAQPLVEIVPVEPATMEGRTIVQWDKYDLDILGLLKVDLLCLGMLSALKRGLEYTGLELSSVPAEDPATYAMIQKADTVGTFQVESRAQMSMAPQIKPKSFYDLVIQIALVRPGPIVGKMVHPYLKRRSGLESFVLPDPRLEPILGRTLGVPIFQEQVQKMAVALAGFTPGESDQLRRAIGAWRSQGHIGQLGKRLMDGLIKNGISKQFADQIFEQIQGFSEYGFPESHAASFALLTYASCYLKCHHPAEFCCALLNSQPMGFYLPHTLIDDAKRHGVRVLPVDVNISTWDCQMEGDRTFRLGLRYVRGISQLEADRILNQRSQQEFTSFEDFRKRVKLKRSTLRTLALGDAFCCFGLDRRHTLWKALREDALCEGGDPEQFNLFSGVQRQKPSEVQVFSTLSSDQEILMDYENYGLSVRGHPMESLRKRFPHILKTQIMDVKKNVKNGRRVELVGQVIVLQAPPTAKGFAFATLEDESGFLDVILSPTLFEKYRETLLNESIFKIQGILQRKGDSISVKVSSLHGF